MVQHIARFVGLGLLLSACNGEEAPGGGSGGEAAEGGSTSQSTSGSTSASVTASSSTGQPEACTGTLALDPTCIPCADAECCREQAACEADDACLLCMARTTPACATGALFQALDACLQSSCAETCDPITPNAADCDAPLPSPSNGACITIGGVIGCNPFTNEGCAAPQVCDSGFPNGFGCFDPPSDAPLCAPCGSAVGNFCAVGMTCVGVCNKLCCDDGDCGSGTCDKTHAQYAPAGICTIP